MSKPFGEVDDKNFLIYVAQNDYMIDNHYLPEGERLMEIAARLKDIDLGIERVGGLVVYGDESNGVWCKDNDGYDTHKALLSNIELIHIENDFKPRLEYDD